MAQQIGNSELLRTWANDGTVVVPADAKIDEGWLRGEQPPHEWMNYIHNVLGQKINHMLSRGVPDWNNSTEFNPGAVVNHDDDLWLALATNTNSEPSAGNSNWARIVDQSKDANIHGLTIGLGAGSITTNTALGRFALASNTTGINNTAVGLSALPLNTTGGANTAVGQNALLNNTTGVTNTAVGQNTLLINTTGDQNTALGRAALTSNTTGVSNTAVGGAALLDNSTGNNNIGVGRNAGRSTSPFTISTQNNRIVMGNNDHTDAYIRIAWTVTSDARDKDNFAPVPHGLDFINALQPTEYQLKAGGRDGVGDGRRRYGFLAQDVLEAEGESPVIVDAEDPENLKLHESYIVPVLVNAIKELTAQVEALQSEVNALKGD